MSISFKERNARTGEHLKQTGVLGPQRVGFTGLQSHVFQWSKNHRFGWFKGLRMSRVHKAVEPQNWGVDAESIPGISSINLVIKHSYGPYKSVCPS